ncbi:GNAT family N-acetyltransferase [Virgibacillus doumboii]|uniref:GNAT family N-acetyltransferase n=1 Tax=Virgibacillus doumboii TaxID=2697503 RepID=UPI0013DEA971|nr:GNAT family N-acetyltransferase [Virgibacillus doumboii]
MNIRFEQSITKYKNKVEDILLEKEACNNLMLGILGRIEHDPEAYVNGYYLGIAEVDGKAVYAFMQTPPNNWILADIEHTKNDVIHHITDFLYTNDVEVPGVMGPTEQAGTFKDAWERLNNCSSTIHVKQLIYRLDDVKPISKGEGRLTAATSNDHQLVKKWLIQFGVEANEQISDKKADQVAESFINNGSLHLWMVNDQPVSMVNQSRKTKNGATINAVFTPDEHKRNGYATASVAALSEKLLGEGFQFCSLYTDLANPTSNNIYKKIGYDEVGRSIVYKF